MVLPLWYTQIPRYVRPHRADLKSPSPGGFVSGSRSNRASYSSLPMRRSNFTLILRVMLWLLPRLPGDKQR
ncbi:Uncharacterised protein [Citrobacter werkmanii]|nr:Uncharacterised protein [Citrobacter werkmanii]